MRERELDEIFHAMIAMDRAAARVWHDQPSSVIPYMAGYLHRAAYQLGHERLDPEEFIDYVEALVEKKKSRRPSSSS